MLLMPTGLIGMWLSGLLSLAMVGGGVYLIWAWDRGIVVGTGYLVAGIALLALSVLGRPLAVLLLGKPNSDGTEAPRHERDRGRGGTIFRLPRPNGSEIFVEAHGPEDAPATLILTHGWCLNGNAWNYAKRHLAGSHRLLIWDLPGLGESKRPTNRDFSLEAMAADLEAVLSLAPEGRPVYLCGHSIGGMITLTFCRLFPQHLDSGRIAGLILTHTTYTNPVHTARHAPLVRALQKPLLQPLCYLMIALSPLVRVMNWLSYRNGMTTISAHFSHFARTETRAQLDFATRFSPPVSPSVAARGMLAMFRYDASTTLPTISVPVLAIAANQDQACVPEASQRIAETVPRGRITTLLPAGHLGLIEQHDAWVETVRREAV